MTKINQKPDFASSPKVDQVGIQDRVSRITARSIKKEAKMQGLKMALNMVDLTTLEGADTERKVMQLCNKAIHLHDVHPNLPTVAAVCVYPNFVKTAKTCLKGSGINVASVATAFPSGQSSLEIKLLDTKIAIDSGAEEVDMVISRGKFHEGEYNFVFDEIAAIKDACGTSRLKVILETGELGTYDKVRRASDIAIEAGADFIKTSTGKISPAATLPVTLVMLEAIKDYYTNDKLGKAHLNEFATEGNSEGNWMAYGEEVLDANGELVYSNQVDNYTPEALQVSILDGFLGSLPKAKPQKSVEDYLKP